MILKLFGCEKKQIFLLKNIKISINRFLRIITTLSATLILQLKVKSILEQFYMFQQKHHTIFLKTIMVKVPRLNFM